MQRELSHVGEGATFPTPIGKHARGPASSAAMIRLRYGMPWVLAACVAGPHGAGVRELVLKLQHLRVTDLLPVLEGGQPHPAWRSKLDLQGNTVTLWAKADVLRELTDRIERLDVAPA